jgi:fructosamine-3-kinase
MKLAERGAALLGGELAARTVAAGGDLSEVVEIELTDGRTAIVKGGPSPVAEAEMLSAMRAAGAPAPAVLAHDESVLVIEVLARGGYIDDAWQDLGDVLARLHAAPGPRYGWHRDYAFGRVVIENGWSDDWSRFWAERRLANQTRHLPPELARRVMKLADELPERLPVDPGPSLLHGDLWGGNVLTAQGRISGLIDPACYFGHREVDFAMLGLFNRPGEQLFDAYRELEPGHSERLPIYQLWPAIVHLRLFGAAYRPMVERLLTAAGV